MSSLKLILSHWKQGAQNRHIQTMVHFGKPGNFFKNRLRSLEPSRSKGCYKHSLNILIFIVPRIFEFSIKLLFP